MKIHAASRPANDTTATARRWTVETDDYESGFTEVEAGVPDGSVLLSVRVERDPHARPANGLE